MIAAHTSIKKKVALSFLSVAALLAALIFAVIATVIFPKIWQLELHNIKTNLFRTLNTIEQEVTNLGHHADDWAYWDDTYQYMAGAAPVYEQANLDDETLRDAKFGFINLISLDGDIVWGKHFKPGGVDEIYSGAPTANKIWPKQFIEKLQKQPKGMSGYFSTQLGILCFAAKPVLTTKQEGPSRGWFIVGRWLDKTYTSRINRQMKQSVIIYPAHEEKDEPYVQHLEEHIKFYIKKLNLTEIRARAIISDYKNDSAFTVTLDEKRTIFIESSKTMLIALIGLILSGTFCTWFSYRRVEKVILEPLSKLAESMEYIGNNKQDLLTTFDNNDEISLVYKKYCEATNKLLKTQEALEERSNFLEIETLTDPLTKLHNRRYLERLMPTINNKVQHHSDEQKLLLVIDIDYFKTLNDNFGHTCGDLILIQLAKLLKSIFREQDHIIRMGGEEFLVIASCRGKQNNQELAERVRYCVEKFNFVSSQNESVTVTVSIGYSWFPLRNSALSGESWQTALKLADYALYQAKSSGRNGWCGYYTKPSITDSQLAMIPDQMEQLVESEVLRKLASRH